MNKFHKGAPPSIGWWPTSLSEYGDADQNKKILPHRWWNGRYWSLAAFDCETAKQADHWAKLKTRGYSDIYWTSRWWK